MSRDVDRPAAVPCVSLSLSRFLEEEGRADSHLLLQASWTRRGRQPRPLPAHGRWRAYRRALSQLWPCSYGYGTAAMAV